MLLSPLFCQEIISRDMWGMVGALLSSVPAAGTLIPTFNLDPSLLFQVQFFSLFLHGGLFVWLNSKERWWWRKQINVHVKKVYYGCCCGRRRKCCNNRLLSSTHQCFMCFSKLCLQLMHAFLILVLFSFGRVTFTLQYGNLELQLLIQCL